MTIRMVVGVDLAAVGDSALDEAIRYLGKIEDGELHPVFVVTDGPDPKTELDLLSEHLEQHRARLREAVLARLRAVHGEGEQRVVFHVRVGDPAGQIHQVAVDMEADLVVVGTQRRTGLSKAILGSVADKLVKTARVPVLVAHPNELADLPKTAWPEPAEPGKVLHDHRVMASENLRFGRRSSHISGLV